jgi:hypothetical protein
MDYGWPQSLYLPSKFEWACDDPEDHREQPFVLGWAFPASTSSFKVHQPIPIVQR